MWVSCGAATPAVEPQGVVASLAGSRWGVVCGTWTPPLTQLASRITCFWDDKGRALPPTARKADSHPPSPTPPHPYPGPSLRGHRTLGAREVGAWAPCLCPVCYTPVAARALDGAAVLHSEPWSRCTSGPRHGLLAGEPLAPWTVTAPGGSVVRCFHAVPHTREWVCDPARALGGLTLFIFGAGQGPTLR